jgi:hypothetical protein
MNPEAPRSIELTNAEGKRAVIDFSGEVVTYSGDMPVAESAQAFFEALYTIFNHMSMCEEASRETQH